MTKEEVIKEAYGSRFEWLKSFICMHDGWCQDKQYNQIDCLRPIEYHNAITEYIRADNGERMVDVFRWMPKQLEGIGDNNGWIKIESEEDLKLDRGYYWFRYRDALGVENIKIAIVDNKGINLYHEPTHYQPIIKPLPPVY